jgi:hypothetical protein
MQGETDGMRSKGGDPTHYAFRLLGLVESLRRDLQRPDMKVVIGRICDWGNGRNWNQVREAQVAFAERDGQAAWVDCDDLNDRLDDDGQYRNDLHYTESGYMRLGQRFAEQAVKLIKAQESKPSTCAHRAVDQDDHPAMPPPIRPPV